MLGMIGRLDITSGTPAYQGNRGRRAALRWPRSEEARTSGRIAEQYDDFEAMPATIQLSDIIDALEMQFEESVSYLDFAGPGRSRL